MRLSAFSPLGALKLSGREAPAKAMYLARIRAMVDAYDTSEGSRQDCTAFAQAMIEAGANEYIKRAGEQRVPSKTWDMLPTRETEYGLVPYPHDTVAERRAAYLAWRRLPAGSNYPNVRQALADLLGADFVALRTTKAAELVVYPSTCGVSPMNLQAPTVPRKIAVTGAAVSLLGSVGIHYTMADQVADPFGRYVSDLLVDDVLVIDPGKLGIEERVTVTAVVDGVFTATYTKPHDVGALCITQPYPMWTSNQRHATIVVSAAASVDPEKRRKVDDLMSRYARVVSTWQIVEGTSTTTAGPFKVGEGLIGITPIVALSLP